MAQRKATNPGKPARRGVARAVQGEPVTVRPARARRSVPASDGSAGEQASLSSGQRREFLGALLVGLTVITLLSFASPGGRLSQWWIQTLRALFGSAATLFTLYVGALGVWLIREGVEDRGPIRLGRPLGSLVFLLSLVGLIHIAAVTASDGRDSKMLAESLEGGGWIGHVVSSALVASLGGLPGTAALILVGTLAASLMAGVSLRQSVMALRLAKRRLCPDRSVQMARAFDGAPAESTGSGATAWPGKSPVGGRVWPQAPEGGDTKFPAARDEPPSATPRPGRPTELVPSWTAIVAASGGSPWQLPRLADVLDRPSEVAGGAEDVQVLARKIESTLAEFGIPVRVVEVNRGPTVTQYALEPGYVDRGGARQKVKVSQIVALQNDLSLALAASPIRVQAPVPGRPYVGVEVPNSASQLVSLRDVLEHESFRRLVERGTLPIALGRDTSGRPVAADLAEMPHLLVAGATGSGKSVLINAIICSLILTHTPASLKLLLIDPKRVEMAAFRGLPHLAAPVVVDTERVVGVLQWAVREMDRRYKEFADAGARNIASYNRQRAEGHLQPLPVLVIIVDELADLMMTAPEETERLVTRLAQLARATGIHLVIATQRPSVDVVTGLIKANIPARIAFAVSSSIDSRVILDAAGAEKLLGRGDMLYQASDSSRLRRLQGCFVSDGEIERLVRFWRSQAVAKSPAGRQLPLGLPEPLIEPETWEAMMTPGGRAAAERDPLWEQVVTLLADQRTASTSLLQRRLRIGYSRAARLLDQLEAAGLVGEAQGNQPRPVNQERLARLVGRTGGAPDAPPPVDAEGDRAPPWTGR